MNSGGRSCQEHPAHGLTSLRSRSPVATEPKARRVSTAFDGKGAALKPGRWNTVGVPVVYSAESRSLASLEILVHVEDTSLLAAIHRVVVPVEIDESLMLLPLQRDRLRFSAAGLLSDPHDYWLAKRVHERVHLFNHIVFV